MQARKERFSPQDLRDLQIYHLLVWFDEDLLARDQELIDLIRKGRDFSRADQAMMARKQNGSARARAAGLSRISQLAGRSKSPPRRFIIRFCR